MIIAGDYDEAKVDADIWMESESDDYIGTHYIRTSGDPQLVAA